MDIKKVNQWLGEIDDKASSLPHDPTMIDVGNLDVEEIVPIKFSDFVKERTGKIRDELEASVRESEAVHKRLLSKIAAGLKTKVAQRGR